jgi:acyl carrier protein
MEDKLYRQVEEFVQKRTNYPIECIRPETRLGHDLGVDGVDAMELMDEFSNEFGVNMKLFVFDRHFGPEGIGIDPRSLFWLIFNPENLHLVPIMISDLWEAAKTKKFPDLSNR